MISGLNHITLSISNMDNSLHFYELLLGFKTIAIWDIGAYLVAPKIWLCLSLDKAYRKELVADYSHLAFSLTRTQFKKISQSDKLNQFKQWKENKSFGESLYILDPDGHQLELHTSTLSKRFEALTEKPYQGLRLAPNWQALLKASQLP